MMIDIKYNNLIRNQEIIKLEKYSKKSLKTILRMFVHFVHTIILIFA